MSYAVFGDIQAEFKDITFASTTAVTDANVTEYIAQEEAALEAEVATIYVTPITGTKAISIMKKMTTLMVKARILDILPVKTGNRNPDQEDPADKLREQVMGENGMLAKIKSKLLILVDATLLESTGGVKSYAVNNDLDHTFHRDTKEW